MAAPSWDGSRWSCGVGLREGSLGQLRQARPRRLLPRPQRHSVAPRGAPQAHTGQGGGKRAVVLAGDRGRHLPGVGPRTGHLPLWRQRRGGLASGLGAEMAARFSFLLATPIILAAGVLEVPKLLEFGTARTLGVALFGGVVAGLAAYGSTALLMLLFRRREVEALGPFGYYCVGAGLIVLLLLLVR